MKILQIETISREDNLGNNKIRETRKFSFVSWSKPLAYLVGVYLSDGCVHKPSENRMLVFSHSSIDKEFVLKTKSALEIILKHYVGYRESVRTFDNVNSNHKKIHTQTIHVVSTSNDEFGEWLREVTKDKTVVPEMNEEYLIHLLSAFIDGDGWISTFRSKNRPQDDGSFLQCFSVGICGKGAKMNDIIKSFKKLEVKVGTKILGKQDVEVYRLNIGSLVDSEVCFSIHRKFFKFCEYVNQVKPSTTIRRTLEYK